MQPFVADLKALTKENRDFRRVVFTSDHAQVVVMAIPPDEEIGEEIHIVDQFLYIVEGEGEAVLNGREQPIDKGEAIAVPAGTRHNVRNTGDEPLKLFTIYAPPQHAAGTVHKTKAEAMKEVLVPA